MLWGRLRVGLRRHQRPRLPGWAVRGRCRRRAVRPAQLPPQRRAAARPARPSGRHPRGRRGRGRCGALAARGHRVLDAALALPGDGPNRRGGRRARRRRGAAVLLYTSGTTAAPKAAVLRHRHLTSYVIGTVEFAGAGPDEAVLVSVPPYHVAGLANLLSNVYLGRRIVYLSQFDAAAWVAAVRREGITNAMVVPTMLARVCDVLDADGAGLPSLRALSYGGAWTPATVLQRVMTLLPDVDLTNAYGLTETSSTIAVLGPDDHRAARDGDPAATARLSSAGRVLPTVEVEVRGGSANRSRPASPARSGAGRAGVGRVRRRRRRSTTRAGSRRGTAAGSTPTGTCSSRAAATTRSSGAARTSRRPRSRRCCCSTPTSPSAPSSASLTTSGASASPPWWCPGPVRAPMPTTSRVRSPGVAELKTPKVVTRRGPAVHRDRQAPPPGRAVRPPRHQLTAPAGVGGRIPGVGRRVLLDVRP